MNSPVIIWGLGEIGGVFARGVLKNNYPVYPITRSTKLDEIAQDIPEPAAVIVAVGESSLDEVLTLMPQTWRDRLVLVQNELLPRDWEKYQLSPTVISIWFEKKPGQDVKVIIPSPTFGAQANFVKETLEGLNIPVTVLDDQISLIKELVIKNLYILTVNIAGLSLQGGVVETLWKEHEQLAREVAHNVLDIQFELIQTQLHREALIKSMVHAFEGDWQHKCMGRSAQARLERALKQADDFNLEVSALRRIATEHG